jgi:hypothetical protein
VNVISGQLAIFEFFISGFILVPEVTLLLDVLGRSPNFREFRSLPFPAACLFVALAVFLRRHLPLRLRPVVEPGTLPPDRIVESTHTATW